MQEDAKIDFSPGKEDVELFLCISIEIWGMI